MTADSQQAEREAALQRRRIAYENLGCELGWDETNGPQNSDWPVYKAVMEYAKACVALSEAAARAAGRGEVEEALREAIGELEVYRDDAGRYVGGSLARLRALLTSEAQHEEIA